MISQYPNDFPLLLARGHSEYSQLSFSSVVLCVLLVAVVITTVRVSMWPVHIS